MRLDRLWLTDFRGYRAAEVPFAPGLTAVIGHNGAGKTSILEAVGWLATLGSFRGAPNEAMVRQGAAAAYIRAEVARDDERTHLLEAELPVRGRSRLQLDRKRVARGRDVLGHLRVVVFTPDDLELVKGGPGGRRRLLDDLLVQLHPRYDRMRSDVERVLRQRNALLKQAGGRLGPEVAATLDVWDLKLAESGTELAAARAELTTELRPLVAAAYDRLAGTGSDVDLVIRPSWQGDLADALREARQEDVRRAVTSVGPHRDDLEIGLRGMPARLHGSQGEQRCLTLALRLAAREVIETRTGTGPLLLLDDVLSELDAGRAEALLALLPATQTVITSAGGVPVGTRPDLVVEIVDGEVRLA